MGGTWIRKSAIMRELLPLPVRPATPIFSPPLMLKSSPWHVCVCACTCVCARVCINVCRRVRMCASVCVSVCVSMCSGLIRLSGGGGGDFQAGQGVRVRARHLEHEWSVSVAHLHPLAHDGALAGPAVRHRHLRALGRDRPGGGSGRGERGSGRAWASTALERGGRDAATGAGAPWRWRLLPVPC